MKKLLLRLRHWLIKKLGGYTEQRVPPVIRRLPAVTLHPERVFIQERVDYQMFGLLRDELDKEKFFAERVKQDLVTGMVKKIIERGDAVLACEPDMTCGPGARIYSMALCIIPANEWMKTDLGRIMDATALRREEP